jgi:hypothetical protein
MATVPNLARPNEAVDRPYLTPNRKVAALPVPLYAGEVILNTADGNMYVAAPPIGGVIDAACWAKYAFGLGLN